MALMEENPHLRTLQIDFAVLARRIEQTGYRSREDEMRMHELRDAECLEKALAVMQRRVLRLDAQLEDARKELAAAREEAVAARFALEEAQQQATKAAAESEESRRALASVGGKDWPGMLEENRALAEAAASAEAKRDEAVTAAATAVAAQTEAVAELQTMRAEISQAKEAAAEMAKERAELLLDLRSSLRQRSALSEKVDALSEELARSDARLNSLTSRLDVLRAANGRLEKRALHRVANGANPNPSGSARNRRGERSGADLDSQGFAGVGGVGPLGAAAVESLVRKIRTRANSEVHAAKKAAEEARATATAAEARLAAKAAENASLRRKLEAAGGRGAGGASSAAGAASGKWEEERRRPDEFKDEESSEQLSGIDLRDASAGAGGGGGGGGGIRHASAEAEAAPPSVERREALDRAVGAVLGGDEGEFVSVLRSADASTRRAILRLLDEEDGNEGAALGTLVGGGVSRAANVVDAHSRARALLVSS